MGAAMVQSFDDVVHLGEATARLWTHGILDYFLAPAPQRHSPWLFHLADDMMQLEEHPAFSEFMQALVTAKGQEMWQTMTAQQVRVRKLRLCLAELQKPAGEQDARAVQAIVRMGREHARLVYTTPDPRDTDVGCLSRGLVCQNPGSLSLWQTPCAFAGAGGVAFAGVHESIVNGCDAARARPQVGVVLRNIEFMTDSQCLEVFTSVARSATETSAWEILLRSLRVRGGTDLLQKLLFYDDWRQESRRGVAAQHGLVQIADMLVNPHDKLDPQYEQVPRFLDRMLQTYVQDTCVDRILWGELIASGEPDVSQLALAIVPEKQMPADRKYQLIYASILEAVDIFVEGQPTQPQWLADKAGPTAGTAAGHANAAPPKAMQTRSLADHVELKTGPDSELQKFMLAALITSQLVGNPAD
jgi:hypothetical protein